VANVVPKEGTAVSGSFGGVVALNKVPHPNAAKVFINWLLSRKGQVALRLSDQEDPPNSRRLDIPKDYLRPEVIPVEGRRYLDMARPEWSDLTPILKIVNEAFKPAK
jgi:ABC-type Fe3+ transport system substrate-binding protein